MKIEETHPIARIWVVQTSILPKLNKLVLSPPYPDSYFTKKTTKKYFNAGFINIQDPFDKEGVFLSLDTTETQYIKTNFTGYASLKRAIF